MRVFNLTPETKIYKGKPIPPDGGSVDFPTLDFIPNRDRMLEEKKVLAFGSLPAWFVREKAARQAPAQGAKVSAPAPAKELVVEAAPEEKKDHKKDGKR